MFKQESHDVVLIPIPDRSPVIERVDDVLDRSVIYCRPVYCLPDRQQYWNVYQPLGLQSRILFTVWLRGYFCYLRLVYA